MKKFIIALSVLVLLFMALDAAHYRLGWYIDLMPEEPVTTFVKTDGKEIYLDCGEGWQPFEIRGVNMGSGIPGKWATEFAIDEETYRRPIPFGSIPSKVRRSTTLFMSTTRITRIRCT